MAYIIYKYGYEKAAFSAETWVEMLSLTAHAIQLGHYSNPFIDTDLTPYIKNAWNEIVGDNSLFGKSGIKTVNGYDAKVNVGHQNKHIPGTNEYKNAWNNGQTKSIMYGDVNDIQNLLNNKAGTGDFFGINKERVDFGQVIGQYVDPDTGIGVETTIGIIHYGKNGAHIVPARPN